VRASLVRLLLLAAVAGSVAVALPTAATPARSHARALSSLEAGVLHRLNGIRAQHGLVPLRLSAALNEAATQHSQEMGEVGYFEHASADDTPFWKRIERWYSPQSYRTWSVGENLLWSSPDIDPVGALKLWMASPEHRRNILDPAWREIGVSAVHVATAPGTYHGLAATIVTTDFGVRHF
jgi:uncharacterized protein YkwD